MSPPAIDHESPQRQLFDLTGRFVLVMGLGESGEAMARWAGSRGARIRLADTRSPDDPAMAGVKALCAELGEAQCVHGAFSEDWLTDIDLVAWSPGLSLELGDSAAFAALVRERGIALAGELDLFMHALAMLAETGYSPKLVGITGTNGKTTTTALAAHLFAACGQTVKAAGNIGPSLLAALSDALQHDTLPAIWVLELSSFQLAAANGFEPHAAVILNLSEDHLDWHTDMASYAAAKRRIHGSKAWVVSNRDDPSTDAPVAEPPAKPVGPRATRRRGAQASGRRVSRFGLDAPRAPGDFGIVQDSGLAWLAMAEPEDGFASRDSDDDAPRMVRRLMPAEALPFTGRHNQSNCLAALALGAAIGLPLAPMLRAVRDFHPGAHRCESVAVIDGIDYINDSKGTNVGATVAALEGMAAGTVLIAGGIGKGQDFAPLARAAARRQVRVLLIGRDAQAIATALAAESVKWERCESLDEAVARGRTLAAPGSAVLLSPACASFDMFRGYAHRGESFRRAVRAIADATGQPLELAC
jgi:UDP-N-acetylmuramoylalanine--D-glutamate ligase